MEWMLVYGVRRKTWLRVTATLYVAADFLIIIAAAFLAYPKFGYCSRFREQNSTASPLGAAYCASRLPVWLRTLSQPLSSVVGIFLGTILLDNQPSALFAVFHVSERERTLFAGFDRTAYFCLMWASVVVFYLLTILTNPDPDLNICFGLPYAGFTSTGLTGMFCRARVSIIYPYVNGALCTIRDFIFGLGFFGSLYEVVFYISPEEELKQLILLLRRMTKKMNRIAYRINCLKHDVRCRDVDLLPVRRASDDVTTAMDYFLAHPSCERNLNAFEDSVQRLADVVEELSWRFLPAFTQHFALVAQ